MRNISVVLVNVKKCKKPPGRGFGSGQNGVVMDERAAHAGGKDREMADFYSNFKGDLYINSVCFILQRRSPSLIPVSSKHSSTCPVIFKKALRDGI